jgi:hypothetical protein
MPRFLVVSMILAVSGLAGCGYGPGYGNSDQPMMSTGAPCGSRADVDSVSSGNELFSVTEAPICGWISPHSPDIDGVHRAPGAWLRRKHPFQGEGVDGIA